MLDDGVPTSIVGEGVDTIEYDVGASEAADAGSPQVSTAVADTAEETGETHVGRSGRARTILALTVAALGIMFIGLNANVLGAGFGYSHDGFNASVWSIGARSMERDGVLESKFGGVSPDRVYANHPPIIYSTVAAARALPIDNHLAARLPALISSLVALGLIAALLYELGFSTIATVGALSLMATSTMFIVFGPMIDTFVLALPICTAIVLILARTLHDKSNPVWLLVGVPLLGALTSWTSVMFTIVAIAALLVRPERRTTSRSTVAPMALGVGTGLVISVSWIWWVYGSLTRFVSVAMKRSGAEETFETTFGEVLAKQGGYLWDAMPILCVVGGIGIVLALRSRSIRPIASVTTLSVVIYALVFRDGAHHHQYWNFALLIAAAVGTAQLLDLLVDRTAPLRHRRNVLIATIGLVAIASLLLPSTAARSRSQGLEIARLFDAIGASGDYPVTPSEPVLGVTGPAIGAAPWLVYPTDGQTRFVRAQPAALLVATLDDPDLPIMVPTDKLPQLVGPRDDLPVIASSEMFTLVNVRTLYHAVADRRR